MAASTVLYPASASTRMALTPTCASRFSPRTRKAPSRGTLHKKSLFGTPAGRYAAVFISTIERTLSGFFVANPIPMGPPQSCMTKEASDIPGSAANIILDITDAKFKKNHPEIKILKRDHGMGDDTFFGDSSIGMPTVWIFYAPHGYHHNSSQNDKSLIDLSMSGATLTVSNSSFSLIYISLTLFLEV